MDASKPTLAFLRTYHQCSVIEEPNSSNAYACPKSFVSDLKNHASCFTSLTKGCSTAFMHAQDIYKPNSRQGTDVNSSNWRDYANLLRRCGDSADLFQGKHIHRQIISSGLEGDRLLGNLLIEMYGKCGALDDAVEVFNAIAKPNLFSWNILITTYGRCGCLDGAKRTFERMPKRDMVSWNGMLQACIQCESWKDAKVVFDLMPQRNVVSWTAMVGAYVQNGQGTMALRMFHQMQSEGIPPNKVTCLAMIDACSGMGISPEGKWMHGWIFTHEIELDVVLNNALINMYGKCQNVHDSYDVFIRMPYWDTTTWNSLIGVYTQNGLSNQAFELFQHMQILGMVPDKVTYVSILEACATGERLGEARSLRDCIVQKGFESEEVVGNALITMFSRCGSVEDAWTAFGKISDRSVVTWNVMLAACVRSGHDERALQLFQELKTSGIVPNLVTYLTVLDVCCNPDYLEEGKRIHTLIVNNGLDGDVAVVNALITMYGKCGSKENAEAVFEKFSKPDVITWTAMLGAYAQCGCLENARALFNEMPIKDVVSWNAMLAAYTQGECGSQALELFKEMELEGILPSKVTCVTMLDACASIGALDKARRLHEYVIHKGFVVDVNVGNALISMYGSCGCLNQAQIVFNEMHQRDLVSWNAIITAYAQNGDGKKALQLFQDMQLLGMMPNKVTLVSVVYACSHVGQTDEGCHFFLSTSMHCKIQIGTDHYNCMADLLGRSGWIEEAEDLIENMLSEAVSISWMTLSGACWKH